MLMAAREASGREGREVSYEGRRGSCERRKSLRARRRVRARPRRAEPVAFVAKREIAASRAEVGFRETGKDRAWPSLAASVRARTIDTDGRANRGPACTRAASSAA